MYNVLHIYACVCVKVKVKLLSSVLLFVTPWTIAYEAMCVYNVQHAIITVKERTGNVESEAREETS